MTIAINNRLSGFRIWAEAHDPTGVAETSAWADRKGALAPPNIDCEATPSEGPHRPWLVPGVGKL
jgi:hypothetical protein